MNEPKKSTKGIVIYTSSNCGYCVAAKSLLRTKGADFIEINILVDPERRQEMIERSAKRTVPQIFIGERHIGGFEDLRELDRSDELDNLLAGFHLISSE
ncbi:MAG: glutaredoxin 3 [Pseudomonadota bacterium]|nr:glutaredoxin 3 [Pseudomonadota bacterium]